MKSMNQPTYIHRVNHDEQDLQMEGEWDYQFLHEHNYWANESCMLKAYGKQMLRGVIGAKQANCPTDRQTVEPTNGKNNLLKGSFVP